MDTKANYTLIGLFVILLSLAMLIVFFWLSGLTRSQDFEYYLIYARGGVSGLNVDSPVQFNGVRVGTVSRIKLDSANPQFVKLLLKINKNTPITESTKSTLVPQGITGLVYVELRAETPQAPPLKAGPGQRYPVIPYEKPFLTQISEVLPDLTKNMGMIAEKVKKVFDDQNIKNISDTLAHLQQISQMLDQKSGAIGGSLDSMNTLLENSAKASQHFEATMISTQQAAAAVDNATPTLEELLTRLSSIAMSLQKFSDDLERNPAVLIRGKQPPPPGPGEH